MKFKIKKFLIVLALFLITSVFVFAQTGSKQSHPASEIEEGTLTGDYSIDGKLGIGTSIPNAKLHLKPTSTTETMAKITGNIVGYTGTVLEVSNSLGPSNDYTLFNVITDSDGDAGGPFTEFLITGKGNVGIGTDSPESTLHIKDTSNNLLALEKSNTGKWNFDYFSNPDLGISSALKIGINSALSLYLADELGGLRMYLWGSRPVPNLPHTGIKPTFAVYGDILVGDILAIERNPMSHFLRVETGLSAESSTNLFSANKGVSDIDGGAHIRMLPDEEGHPYSGSLKLIAYGQGEGRQANSIRFMTRSGPDWVVDRAWINSKGLYVDGKITATGGIDPPYVSYSEESHESIREFAKDVEEHEEVMEFWNGKTHRKEIYVIDEDSFYTITGELIS